MKIPYYWKRRCRKTATTTATLLAATAPAVTTTTITTRSENDINSTLSSSSLDDGKQQQQSQQHVVQQPKQVVPPKLLSLTQLTSMTVPNLKRHIQDCGWYEKGLYTSKLKRKQDMIEFVFQKQQQKAEEDQPQPKEGEEQSKGDGERLSNNQNSISILSTTKDATEKRTSLTLLKMATTTTTSSSRSNKYGVKMPPRRNEIVENTKPPQQQQSSSSIEQLYLQYPPLRYMINSKDPFFDKMEESGNNSALSNTPNKGIGKEEETSLLLLVPPGLEENNDFRQIYHPMLQRQPASSILTDGNDVDEDDEGADHSTRASTSISEMISQPQILNAGPLSGDMDLIFIGTASCAPSVTRGVSCTALRLYRSRNRSSSSTSTFSSTSPHGDTTRKQQQQKPKSQPPQLGTWIFDCGESTQLQIQRTTSVRPSRITKIFLTHAHGDHSFGLPGLLCMMGLDRSGTGGTTTTNNDEESNMDTSGGGKKNQCKVVDIYGPEGLRMWLRVAIRYSVSRIVPPYRVHELMNIPMAPEWTYSRRHEKFFYNLHEKDATWGGVPSEDDSSSSSSSSDAVSDTTSWTAIHHRLNLEPSSHWGEVEGGRDIYPHYDHPLASDGAPVWEVEDEGDVKVYAAPMSHGIPCVGYVVKEEDRPGRLRDELIRPICERNIEALKNSGYTHPLKAMAVIKNLPLGSSFTFPDGTVVSQEEAVEPPRPGRKIVICGDTNSARSLEKLAQNADVVVHEATNTYLHGYDNKDTNLKTVARDAMIHGHSTPQMAGWFAKRVGAKRLILNHFSPRYPGDASLDSMAVMTRIEEQAIKASKLSRDKVAAAWDFMIYSVRLGSSQSDDDGCNTTIGNDR